MSQPSVRPRASVVLSEREQQANVQKLVDAVGEKEAYEMLELSHAIGQVIDKQRTRTLEEWRAYYRIK